MANLVDPLTDAQVVQVKTWLLQGYSQREVAEAVGRSTQTIARIAQGVTYTHVRVEGEARLRRPNRLLGDRPAGKADLQAAPTPGAAEAEAALVDRLRAEGLLGNGKV